MRSSLTPALSQRERESCLLSHCMSLARPKKDRIPPTESSAARRVRLDTAGARSLVSLIVRGGVDSVRAARRAVPHLARAAWVVARAYSAGGRIFLVGAGTSGRLCAQEAAECWPTFGVPRGRIDSIVAGGRPVLWRAVEGAEDDAMAGRSAIRMHRIDANDCVIAVTASGKTPFVLAALRESKRQGAATILVTSNPRPACSPAPDVLVVLRTGAETLTGSTRLKAGTAAKLALNAITTAGMSLAGRTFGSLMIDVRPTSAKLRERARRIVMELCGVNERTAASLLARSGYEPKTAVLMRRRKVSPAEARRILRDCGGFLRAALAGHGIGHKKAQNAQNAEDVS
ncbi:MAG: N-acetylmuramic acid 6-phosphate etherase [Planctomycetota bacterium]|nr:N-acetylmuramic acid 6-phosphate etherase [Planctomycetota bacterium]